MKIEIRCPDLNTAFDLTHTPPPEGCQWEPLPPVELENEAPIQAKELSEIIPIVVFLSVPAGVAV